MLCPCMAPQQLAAIRLTSVRAVSPLPLQASLASRFKSKFSQAVVDGNLAAVARAHKELVSE